MEYIYVLDYSDAAIYEIQIDSDKEYDVEDLLESKGLNINTCNWMIVNNQINEIIEL